MSDILIIVVLSDGQSLSFLSPSLPSREEHIRLTYCTPKRQKLIIWMPRWFQWCRYTSLNHLVSAATLDWCVPINDEQVTYCCFWLVRRRSTHHVRFFMRGWSLWDQRWVEYNSNHDNTIMASCRCPSWSSCLCTVLYLVRCKQEFLNQLHLVVERWAFIRMDIGRQVVDAKNSW